MARSVILGIDELAQGQTQAFSTVNDMLAFLEQASNRRLALSVTTTDYTLLASDFTRYWAFDVSGLTADRTLTLPTVQNGNSVNRVIAIRNASNDYALTVQGPTTFIRIPARSQRIIHVLGGEPRVLAEGGLPSGIYHTVALFAAGLPTDGAEVLRYVFTEKVTWSSVSTLSGASVGTPPAPGAGLFLYKNGTYVGRILVSTGGAFTWAFDAVVTWVKGDILTVKYFALEVGTITFNAVADTNDTITLNDGTNTPVTYTFGGGVGQVVPGASASDSALAFKDAVEAGAQDPYFFIERSTNVLTVWNLLTAGGGAITKSDADNDYTIVNFATDSSSENYAVTFTGERT
jgi:hypothetical protein